MKFKATLIAAAISALVTIGCDRGREPETSKAGAVESAAESTADTTAEKARTATQGTTVADPAAITQAKQMFEDFFQEHLSRSPEFKTFLGMKEDYGKWDDLSPEFAQETHDINLRQLAALNALDPRKLDDATRLSLKLARRNLEQDIESYKWRLHDYPVNQMYAVHTAPPPCLSTNTV